MTTWSSNLVRIAACLSLFASAHGALGQSTHGSPHNFSAALLDAFRPKFDAVGSSFTTAAYTVAYQYGVGRTERVFVTASIPFAHSALDGGDGATSFGNPYLGVTMFSRSDPVVYEFGIRIPLASDNEGGTSGFYGDFDRFEAYLPDMFTVRSSLIYFPSRSGSWVMLTRLSPWMSIRTGDSGSDARGELYVDYAVHFLYYGRVLQGGPSLTGRAALTEDGSFGERTVHHLGFTVQKDFGPIIPAIYLRIPLDSDLRDVVDYVLGVSLVIPT